MRRKLHFYWCLRWCVMLQCSYPFLKSLLPVKMVLEWHRIVGEKNMNVPRRYRHCVQFLDFHFSVVLSVCCTCRAHCWYVFWDFYLLFLREKLWVFFVAKLSSNSSSSGDWCQDALKAYIYYVLCWKFDFKKAKKKPQSEKTHCSQFSETSKYAWLTGRLK